MRRILGAICALTVVVGGGAVAAGAAVGGGIGEPEPQLMTVDPTSGAPGSTFEVSGDGCVGKGEDETRVEVSAPDTVETGGTATTDEGAWSLTLTVPDDAAAGATIDIDAVCIVTIGGEPTFQSFRGPPPELELFEYQQAQFTVTATPTTEPPATDDTTSTSEPSGEVDSSAAEAAEATVAQPTFTG